MAMKSSLVTLMLTAAVTVVVSAQTSSGAMSPILIKRVEPEYTYESLQRRIEGTATVQLVVGLDGSVTEARVTKSIDPSGGLDGQAIFAVRRWRFLPGRVNGQPVPALISVDVPFLMPRHVPIPGAPPSTESEFLFKQGTSDSQTAGF